MKRYFFLLTMLVATQVALAGPEVCFVEKTHDFGNIKEADGAVTYKFAFSNDGDAPLVIVSAKADCGCTKPVYPLNPVEPNGAGTITVTFNPRGYAGEFTKVISVKTNDKKHKLVKLKISGLVIPKRTGE